MLKKIGKYYFQKRGYYPVTIAGKNFRGDPYHIGFWRIVNKRGFEPEYFKLLDKYLTRDSVYCDIGAWIGPTAVYAATLCKQVYAFEPDEIAYSYLLQNMRLNHIENIEPYNFAIAPKDGEINMASHGGKQGDSMSSMINIEGNKNYFKAKAVSWENWLKEQNPGKIDFIKIDIEGGEVEVIPAMIKFLELEKPHLFLSIHGPYIRSVPRIQTMLELLSFYPFCFDEKLIQVKFSNDFFSSLENKFCSFLFSPSK